MHTRASVGDGTNVIAAADPDPNTTPPDTFELHVFVNGTDVYDASGPLISGDLVVK